MKREETGNSCWVKWEMVMGAKNFVSNMIGQKYTVKFKGQVEAIQSVRGEIEPSLQDTGSEKGEGMPKPIDF
jgi:hypothetical protein